MVLLTIFKLIKMEVKVKFDVAAINEFKAIISTTVEKVVTDVLQKEKATNKDTNSDDELLTRKEVMEILKVSHATLYHYQINGIIPYLKIGNRVYFKRKDIYDNPKLKGVFFTKKWKYDED